VKLIRPWAVVGVLLVGIGCEAQKAYDRGMELLTVRQYDAAVDKLSEAVRLAKKNEKYLSDLQQAKAQGADWHVQKARAARDQSDLGVAKSHLDKALAYVPEHIEAKNLLTEVRASTEQAETLRTDARGLAAENRWDEAVGRMRMALQAYRSLPGGKAELSRYKAGAADAHVKVAQQNLTSGDWKRAAKEAREALSFVPDHSRAKSVLSEVSNRTTAEDYIQQADKLLTQGEPAKALAYLNRALRLHKDRADLPTKIAAAKVAVGKKAVAEAGRLIGRQKNAEALRVLQYAKGLAGEAEGIAPLMRQASRALAVQHVDAAGRFNIEQFPGNALLHHTMALGYDPNNLEATEGVRQAIGHIRKRTRYTVGIVGFKADAKNKGLADALEAAALQHLIRIKPANVEVMDRADLDKILQEQRLSATELVDPNFRIPAGKLKGIGALVTGRIISYELLTSRTHKTGQTKYQQGTRTVANPKYAQAQQQYQNALREFNAARNNVASAEANLRNLQANPSNNTLYKIALGAAQFSVSSARQRFGKAQGNLAAAQAALNTTPQNVRVPNILRHTFPIYTVTGTAKLVASLKVLDSTTGDVVLAEQMTGTWSASDRYIKAEPTRNVTGDPIDLPDQRSFRDKALAAAKGKLDRAVERAVFKHGTRFAVLARRAEAAGDPKQAVEHCMSYLFAYPVGAEQTAQMLPTLSRSVGGESDLVNLKALLRQHCHILQDRGKLPMRISESNNQLVVTYFADARHRSAARTPCRLTAVDGNAVNSLAALNAMLAQHGAGDTVTLSLVVGNRPVTLEAELIPAE